ncbi:Hypothetical predicted protein [Lynx pardinus]|uniref:Uncharacterized protein n=1 Tax=Lynx pardinus TaxID=191816 RepID=A0A485P889_LYNPA|nr:Hypothetical predicted protein [Lynx pardinus]
MPGSWPIRVWDPPGDRERERGEMVLWSHALGSSGRSSCPEDAWCFLFPVPGVVHSEASWGTLAFDTSCGSGACGWPLAGPVSQPQAGIQPGILRLGYSLCP